MMRLQKNTIYLALLVLLCAILLSSCNNTAEDADSEKSGTPGSISKTNGSVFDFIGWWQLTDNEGDIPFDYIEIPADALSVDNMVNCYSEDGDFIDTGYIDYSEQRALNGKDLMVFVFQDIGEYGVSPINSSSKKHILIRDSAEFSGTFSVCDEDMVPIASPQNPVVKLSAKNAELSDAPDVVLEPKVPPFNLGGWKDDNKVAWNLNIARAGDYVIWLDYSCPYSPAEVWGTVNLYAKGKSEPQKLEFRVDTTSSYDEDWSNFQYSDVAGTHLKAGSYRLEIIPGTGEHALSTEHFINLRSVLLTYGAFEGRNAEEKRGGRYSLADFIGWWYQAPDAEFDYSDVSMTSFHVDEDEELWIRMDKYGNDGFNATVKYYPDEDLFYARAIGADVYLSFSEDNLDNLYDLDGNLAFVRGEAPTIVELALPAGKWYIDGNIESDAEHIEVFDNGKYSYVNNKGEKSLRFLNRDGEWVDSDDLVLTPKDSQRYHGLAGEYIVVQMVTIGSALRDYGEAAYDLKALIVSRHETEGGMDYTVFFDIYIHESVLSSPVEANNALQRARLFGYTWEIEGGGSIEFAPNGAIVCEGAQTKFGTWEYQNGLLTISWKGEFTDGGSKVSHWDSSVEEKCAVDNVGEGLTIPSVGRVTCEKQREG